MDLSIGDKVFLSVPLSYLKTAENVPMLRPPDLISHEELGEIVGIRSNDVVEVRFRRGTFLLPIDRLARQII